MKKTKLFKSLLVAAGLCVGANAWAGDEWSIDLAAIGNSLKDKTNMTISDEVVKIGGTSMGTCTAGDNALNENFVLQTGTVWMFRTGSQGLYQYNSGGRSLGMRNCTEGQIITITATGDPNPSTNATLKSSSNGTYVYTVTEDGNVKFTPARYLYFTSISVANPSATDVDYTVKYVDGNNNEIKTATTYSGKPGASITLGDNDKAAIYSDSKKYIYSADDSEGKTIASDGTTVVTVTFREAATYSWTAKSSVGNYSISGETFEGDKASAKYPLYVLVDGTLWTKATAGNASYAVNFDVTENNQEYTIEYTETAITDVVFLTEMEDVEGMGIVNSGNAEARSSQRAAGYSASGSTKFATLPQGKYKMTARFFSPTSAGGNFKFYTGNRSIFEKTTGNANATDATSEEFVLANESNDILLGQCGATAAVDFVYIQSAGTPTEEELAEAAAADVEANTTKYYVVGSMNNWTASEDYRMVLNEEASAEEYSIKLNFTSGDEFKVIGVLGETTTWYPGEGNNYPITAEGDYKVYFRPNYDGGESWHNGCIYASLLPEYTVAGSSTVLFGTVWDVTNTDNDMTENEDGTYSITYTNVELTGDVEYKVVLNHAWNTSWPSDNQKIGISMAGYYDLTIHFNPSTGDVYETMAVYKNISSAGYATFCAPYDLNFEGTGVTAYVATINGSEVSFQEVTSAKANTGLLLKATEGSYAIAMEQSTSEATSALVGVLEDTSVAAGIYVLMNGTAGVGFYKTTNEFTVGANTAYIPATDGARSFIAIDGEATGIEGIAAEKSFDGAIYNLQGQRVEKAQKGLYIINGKKVLVK